MSNPRYIADHLVRIAAEHRDSPEAKLDSFRRIASNADILETHEELTPEKALEITALFKRMRYSNSNERTNFECL
jgi:hypothetical protein